MEVSNNTLGSWTRSKNDQPTCENDNSKNSELYRFMTFAPDYLKEGSCVAGNTQNCATYANMDIGNEPRFGQLTNLNEIQDGDLLNIEVDQTTYAAVKAAEARFADN